MKQKDLAKVHPIIPDLVEELRKGKIDRREFLRTTTLLGLSAAAAYAIAGPIAGNSVVPSVQAATPKKGGIIRCAMQVQDMSDPAIYDWVEKSNVSRQMVEYITITGADNVTRPLLAESWTPSDDL